MHTGRDWREGEGPCRPTVERQARRKTAADTTPMGPDMVNDGRNLRERCMHACSKPKRGTVGGNKNSTRSLVSLDPAPTIS